MADVTVSYNIQADDEVNTEQTSLSFNDSGFYRDMSDQRALLYAVTLTRNIFVPTNVLVGLMGNFLALAVFTASHQRHLSSSGYLAALACADNLFLVSLFVTWLDGIRPILMSDGSCRVIIFITYISSFLSVWYVVCFTSERYIAICHSLRAPMILGKLSEKAVVIVLVILACLLYNFALWTTSVAQYRGRPICISDDTYFELMNIVTWIDTAITMIIPFLLILFMNLRIVWCVFMYQSKRRSILQTHTTAVKNTSQMRITRTLLLVSTTFLVLNLPSHVIRLEQLIISHRGPVPLYKMLIQELTQLIYYSTFSVNFFLYAIYGKHFKRSLKIMLNNLCRRKQPRGSEWSRSDYNRTSLTSMHMIQRNTNGSMSKNYNDL
ncbi:hypothetical protein SNE40_014448 [Patella caerulea]|uniref:G-protein coupled receptors family 1 profile domain-containing protein n=1 Tax=Patella caerulea TaxID=87958 RepID=A0AAN8PH99_PATCE